MSPERRAVEFKFAVQNGVERAPGMKTNKFIRLYFSNFSRNPRPLFLRLQVGFQRCPGVPGEVFDMQNPNLQPEMQNKELQRRKLKV